jgi:hypothetical protein
MGLNSSVIVIPPSQVLRVNEEDLEIQDMDTIPDDLLVKDIKFMQALIEDARNIGLTEEGAKDKSFCQLFNHNADFPGTLPVGPSFGTMPIPEEEKKRQMKIAQERTNEFFFVWFGNSIYTSVILQLAIRDDRITIGNILAQWHAEVKNRLAARIFVE